MSFLAFKVDILSALSRTPAPETSTRSYSFIHCSYFLFANITWKSSTDYQKTNQC